MRMIKLILIIYKVVASKLHSYFLKFKFISCHHINKDTTVYHMRHSINKMVILEMLHYKLVQFPYLRQLVQ